MVGNGFGPGDPAGSHPLIPFQHLHMRSEGIFSFQELDGFVPSFGLCRMSSHPQSTVLSRLKAYTPAV